MTACDMGLGADTDESAPLDPKEPGENATGLYRRKFIVPPEWFLSNISGNDTLRKSGGGLTISTTNKGGLGRVMLVFEGTNEHILIETLDKLMVLSSHP